RPKAIPAPPLGATSSSCGARTWRSAILRTGGLLDRLNGSLGNEEAQPNTARPKTTPRRRVRRIMRASTWSAWYRSRGALEYLQRGRRLHAGRRRRVERGG